MRRKYSINFNMLIIMLVILFAAIIVWWDIKTNVKTTNMANYWSSYGTVLQAVFACFQAVFAGVLIIITRALAVRQEAISLYQNELANQQTKIAEEQKEMTRRQIDLGLFDKRYSIYCSVKDIVYGLFEKEYPEQGSDTWETVDKYLEYNEQACKSIEACDNTILDKLAADFLIDDSGEEIIRNLKGNIGKYIGVVCRQIDYSSEDAQKEIMAAEYKINNCVKEFHEYMRKYLDFTKI